MSERKVLTSAEILGANDIKREYVTVKEWGGDVLVRGMTADERDEWEVRALNVNVGDDGKVKYAYNNRQAVRSWMCAKCIISEDGTRMFSDAEMLKLGNKSADALDKVFTVARRLSGLTRDDLAELEGNSARTDTDGSS